MIRSMWIALALGCAAALPVPERETVDEEPEIVSVDWLGRGRRYAARIVERRDGLTGVQYADGEREWVETARIAPLPDLTGRTIQIHARGSAHAATVIERRERFYHVRLGDGGDTWVDGTQLYAIEEPPAPPPPEQPPRPAFARRRPAEPSEIVSGARVLAYWLSGEEPQLSQPWICQVRAVMGGRADLVFADGSEAQVPLDYVLHVFPRNAGRLRAGDRVWIRNGNTVGFVFERQGRLVKIGYDAEEQSWIEASEVIGRVAPIDRDRVVAGAHVTAVWGSGSPYHATVTAREGDQVTLQWHDGSAPGTVAVEDVIEVWDAR